MNGDEDLKPSFVDHLGREYYNRTMAARYVGMTDTGFRKRGQKIENEQGIIIPKTSRGGNQKLIDRRILDQFRKPMRVGKEHEWYEKLKQIIETINNEE